MYSAINYKAGPQHQQQSDALTWSQLPVHAEGHKTDVSNPKQQKNQAKTGGNSKATEQAAVCLDHLKGECTRRRWRCKFAHPDLSKFKLSDGHAQLCEVWVLTGACKFGRKCEKLHPPRVEEEAAFPPPLTSKWEAYELRKALLADGTAQNEVTRLTKPESTPETEHQSVWDLAGIKQQLAVNGHEYQGSNHDSDDLSSKSLGLTDSDLDCYDQDDAANNLQSVPNWLEPSDARKFESAKQRPERESPASEKDRFRHFLMGILRTCTPAPEGGDATMWNHIVLELKTTVHV